MIRSINTLNSRGQSILYAAYRFLPQSDDFAASIKCLLSVPGIDLRIKNRLNANGETDMALSGMAADHPDLSFIVKQIAEFVGASAAPGAYGALAEECNVFDIIHRRILKTEGYKSLGAQGQKLKLP